MYNSISVLPFPYTQMSATSAISQLFGPTMALQCFAFPYWDVTKQNIAGALDRMTICYICNSLVWSLFPFFLLRFDKAKHCRAIGQNGKITKNLQTPCLFHINVYYICNFSLIWSFHPTMFWSLLLRFKKAKHCRAIGQKDGTIERLQIPCLFHIPYFLK